MHIDPAAMLGQPTGLSFVPSVRCTVFGCFDTLMRLRRCLAQRQSRLRRIGNRQCHNALKFNEGRNAGTGRLLNYTLPDNARISAAGRTDNPDMTAKKFGSRIDAVRTGAIASDMKTDKISAPSELSIDPIEAKKNRNRSEYDIRQRQGPGR